MHIRQYFFHFSYFFCFNRPKLYNLPNIRPFADKIPVGIQLLLFPVPGRIPDKKTRTIWPEARCIPIIQEYLCCFLSPWIPRNVYPCPRPTRYWSTVYADQCHKLSQKVPVRHYLMAHHYLILLSTVYIYIYKKKIKFVVQNAS